MKLSNKQIKEIAETLNTGINCFIHKKTGEIESLPDFDRTYADTDGWEDVIEKIEENEDDYYSIEGRSSSESFDVMETFADLMTGKLRKSLNEALRRRKPFRQFRDVLDYNEEALQKWYTFKERSYINYVRDELEFEFELEDAIVYEDSLQPSVGIDFDGKQFFLVDNSSGGEVTTDVSFNFEQDGDLVTAHYEGGNILHGEIVAKLEGNQLNMMYQCMTADRELKAGKAIAKIEIDSVGKLRLKLDWEWIAGAEGKGESEYCEG